MEIGCGMCGRPLVGTWEDGRLVNRCFVGGKRRERLGESACAASQLQDRSTR